MREQSLESLDLNALNLLKKTERAMTEGYFHYAGALAMSLVNRYPNVPSLRLLLRQSAVGQKQKSLSPLRVYPQALLQTILFLINGRLFNYLNALEGLLNKAPDNRWVHYLFAYAAKKGELWQTSALSFETLAVLEANQTKYTVELAHCFLRMGRAEEAQELVRKVLEIAPQHSEASEILKEASVAQTLGSKEWNS